MDDDDDDDETLRGAPLVDLSQLRLPPRRSSLAGKLRRMFPPEGFQPP